MAHHGLPWDHVPALTSSPVLTFSHLIGVLGQTLLYLFFLFWLRWVFVAAHRLSLVAASGLLIVVASLVVKHGL